MNIYLTLLYKTKNMPRMFSYTHADIIRPKYALKRAFYDRMSVLFEFEEQFLQLFCRKAAVQLSLVGNGDGTCLL